jgi:hypothetical protein
MIVVAGLAALYAVLCAALFALMLATPDRFARTMRHVPWPVMVALPFKPLWIAARAGDVKVGDLAPDFSLASADGKTQLRLSELRGRSPVVLVFGSYT